MKVAILVPTKNRPDFILRMLSYYNLTNSSHPILIGDASDLTTSKKIRDIINEFKNLEVKYFHWENVGCNQTIYRLTNEASKNYDYAAQQGDDDFLIPSSLSKCALFLSNNPDYLMAQGRVGYLRLDRPGAFGRIESIGEQWRIKENTKETSIERFLHLHNDYYSSCFCVHRTKDYINNCGEIHNTIIDPTVGEYFKSYVTAIKGKAKFIDTLYMITHLHPGIIHAWQNPVKWVLQEHWGTEYHKIISELGKALYETGELTEVKAKEFVYEKFFEMINESMLGWGNRNKKSYKYKIKIKQNIPPKIKTNLMIIRDRIKNIYNRGSSDLRLMNLKKSKYYSDFMPIVKSISNIERLSF